MNERSPAGSFVLRAAAVAGAGSAYALLFLVHPRPDWPAPFGFAPLAIEGWSLRRLGLTRAEGWTLCVVLFGFLVPVVAAIAFRHAPHALLLGRARAPGWRLVVLGFAAGLVPVVWVGSHPAMVEWYSRATVEGPSRLIRFVLLVTAEHVWTFGAVLGVAIGRSHAASCGEHAGFVRRWLGVDFDGRAASGIAAAAVVFVICHLGKSAVETLGAAFAGLGLGWITWRARSVWPAVVLHLLLGLALAVVARSAAS